MNDKLNRRILYIGTDNGFWDAIRFTYSSTYKHIHFEWTHLGKNGKFNVTEVVIEALKIKPTVIYVDFSKFRDEITSICGLLSRLHALASTPKVGLVEKLTSSRSCWAAGVDLIYVKSGEYHDIVFHPFKMAHPKQVEKPDFALARFKKKFQLIEDVRIGFINKEYLRMEGNIDLSKGDVIHLENTIPEDIVPSKEFFVKKAMTKDLYYDFKNSFDLGFVFVDRPDLDRSALDQVITIQDAREREKAVEAIKVKQKEELAEYDHKLKKSQKKTADWVIDNYNEANEKKTKVLIIDPSMSFLSRLSKPLDQYPCHIRCQTDLDPEMNYNDIEKIMPDIIAIKYLDERVYLREDGKPEDDLEVLQDKIRKEESKATRQIEYIVKKIKSIGGHTPFILIFRCSNYSSKAFQDTFEYQLLITNPDDVDINIILKMSTIFETKQKQKIEKDINDRILTLRKKDPVKYGRLTKASLIEQNFFLKKSDNMSFASLKREITITAMTESELVLLSDEELVLTNYRLDSPFNMYIRLIPQDGQLYIKDGGSKRYLALIHGIGETEKKELRRYVNEIFLAVKIEGREKEELAFRELNEKKAMEKEEGEHAVGDDSSETGKKNTG